MPEPIASSYDYKCHTGLIKFKVNMEQFSLENEPFVDSFKAYLKGIIHILRHHFQVGEGGGALCFEWGFMRTFPGYQDVAVK